MDTEDIQIIRTGPGDIKNIVAVETEAFGEDDEARLTVDLLGDPTAEPYVSLLAMHRMVAIGHILFTRVKIGTQDTPAHILAPLAVKPAFQNQGVGGMLIKEGCRILKEMGTEIVFVLGHIEYYPKYGFVNDAGKAGFTAPYPIPAEVADAWMLQSLKDDKSLPERGPVTVALQLDKPEYWRE